MIFKTYLFLLAVCCLYAVTQGGMLLFIPTVIVGMVGAFYVNKLQMQRDHIALLKEYAVRVDNIYVYSLYEDDRTVVQRAKIEAQLLWESGNKTDIAIHKIIFRDGLPHETWEEFEARLDSFIKADAIARHKELKQRGGVEFYEAHALNQI